MKLSHSQVTEQQALKKYINEENTTVILLQLDHVGTSAGWITEF